jgi:SOS-response transcriptional repressor LexA
MKALGIRSKSHVHRILKSLTFRGFISQHKGRSRAIEILKPIPGPASTIVRDFVAPIDIPGGLAQLQDEVTTKIVGDTWATRFGVECGDTLVLCPHDRPLDGAVVLIEEPGKIYRLARTVVRENGIFLVDGRKGRQPVPYCENAYCVTKRVIGLIRRMDQVQTHA